MSHNKIDKQLRSVSESYDRGIRLGRRGVDLYKDLPGDLKNDPDYVIFQKARTNGLDSLPQFKE